MNLITSSAALLILTSSLAYSQGPRGPVAATGRSAAPTMSGSATGSAGSLAPSTLSAPNASSKPTVNGPSSSANSAEAMEANLSEGRDLDAVGASEMISNVAENPEQIAAVESAKVLVKNTTGSESYKRGMVNLAQTQMTTFESPEAVTKVVTLLDNSAAAAVESANQGRVLDVTTVVRDAASDLKINSKDMEAACQIGA